MISTLIVTRGVSGCGKTTEAHREAARRRAAGRRALVTELDLWRDRLGVHWLEDPDSEPLVGQMQLAEVRAALAVGVDVIVADTNLATQRLEGWRTVAEGTNAAYEVLDLTYTPVEWCISRDALRPRRVPGGPCSGRQVGAEVIRRQFRTLQEALAAEAV